MAVVTACICVVCTGRLILNMNKDVYMQLGLEGKTSKFVQKHKSRYVVNIDLISAHFVPSKKNYKRVEWCFTERLNLVFDFIIAWVPYGNKNKLLLLSQYVTCIVSHKKNDTPKYFVPVLASVRAISHWREYSEKVISLVLPLSSTRGHSR